MLRRKKKEFETVERLGKYLIQMKPIDDKLENPDQSKFNKFNKNFDAKTTPIIQMLPR